MCQCVVFHSLFCQTPYDRCHLIWTHGSARAGAAPASPACLRPAPLPLSADPWVARAVRPFARSSSCCKLPARLPAFSADIPFVPSRHWLCTRYHLIWTDMCIRCTGILAMQSPVRPSLPAVLPVRRPSCPSAMQRQPKSISREMQQSYFVPCSIPPHRCLHLILVVFFLIAFYFCKRIAHITRKFVSEQWQGRWGWAGSMHSSPRKKKICSDRCSRINGETCMLASNSYLPNRC